MLLMIRSVVQFRLADPDGQVGFLSSRAQTTNDLAEEIACNIAAENYIE